MIRIPLVILFVSYIVIIQAQETERVVKYFTNSKQIMEEFDVLKSNHNIKQGYYARYYRAHKDDYILRKEDYLQKQGFYFQNRLDSIWTYYKISRKSNEIIKEERYNKGKKTGIWTTVLENGKVIKRFDYDNNIELEPIFRFYTIYPIRALESGIEGTVEIYVRYYGDCKVDTILVQKTANEILDKSALYSVIKQEELRSKYSLRTDCTNKPDTTYVINYETDK